MTKDEQIDNGLDLLSDYLTDIQYRIGTNENMDKAIELLSIDNYFEENGTVQWYFSDEFD